MGVEIFICTHRYKKISHLCVAKTEILLYLKNHNMKCSRKIDKIQDRWAGKLQRVGHM
jgi:hypothetical protein